MDRNQSPMTRRGSVARQIATIAAIIVCGVVGALVLPTWIAAMVMLVGLLALRRLATTEPALVPVVIRRDLRR